MNVGFGEAGEFNAARFEIGPAEFLGGLNLAIDAVGGFVADASENHRRGL